MTNLTWEDLKGTYGSPEDFIEEYTDEIKELKEALSNIDHLMSKCFIEQEISTEELDKGVSKVYRKLIKELKNESRI